MNKKTKITLFIFSLLMLEASLSNGQKINYTLPPGSPYWRIGSYSEGLSKVEIGSDSVGFINRSGKFGFALKYDYAYSGEVEEDGTIHFQTTKLKDKETITLRHLKDGSYKGEWRNKEKNIR